MIANPPTIDGGATVGAAARAMRAAKTGRICILAEGRLVGIATWTDLAWASSFLGGSADDVPIADVMTRDPVVVGPGATIEEAARTLYWHGVQALPVVEGQHLVGLITGRDIIGVFIRRIGADIRGIALTVDLGRDLSGLRKLSDALAALGANPLPFALNARVSRHEARARIRVAQTSLRLAEQLAAAGLTVSELHLDTGMDDSRRRLRRKRGDDTAPEPPTGPGVPNG
jgi:hypothetical protein